eukprot:5033282-Amphidinium_carterae.1
MAFAQTKAREGDQEAQRVYDQLADAPNMHNMLTSADQEVPVGAHPLLHLLQTSHPWKKTKQGS